VDGLNGVGGALLRDLLVACGCRVTAVGVEPAPDFGGVTPNPMLPEARRRAAEVVRSSRAVAGFVLDGDADRLGVIDERGEFVAPHDVFGLLLPVAAATAPSPAAVATTVETGSIVSCVAAELGRRTIETPVGFKHISPAMREGRVFAGAGAVGDLGFRHHSFDRDAPLAALMLVRLLSERRASLGKLAAGLRRRYGSTTYFGGSFAIPPESVPDLTTLGRTALSAASLDRDLIGISEVDGAKLIFGARDFLSLRRGTTEPVLRVSLELSTAGRAADAILESIRLQLDG
jgi:phosphomannomutase